MSTGRSIHAVPSITPSPREGIEDGPRLRADPLGLSNWQMTQKTAHPCQPAAQASQPSLSTVAGLASAAPIRTSFGLVCGAARSRFTGVPAKKATRRAARPCRRSCSSRQKARGCAEDDEGKLTCPTFKIASAAQPAGLTGCSTQWRAARPSGEGPKTPRKREPTPRKLAKTPSAAASIRAATTMLFQLLALAPPRLSKASDRGNIAAGCSRPLRTKLPSDHEWADVRADDVPTSARTQIEALVIKAAMAEGLRPSVENLPRDGSLIRRERVDQDSGARSIEWLGRKSFIADMGRESQLVARIADPRRGIVHWGEPLHHMR